MAETLIMGAVAYAPKVVTIWDGFKAYFARHGLDFDYVLFSSYERQVDAHLDGQLHVAWNSPLAWVHADRLARRRGQTLSAVAMRDTDRDLTSLLVVRTDSGIHSLVDLRGKTVGFGAKDSPQATLIPLDHLHQAGLAAGRDFTARRFDVLVGKHGDHIGGEKDVVAALARGEIDAAWMIDGNYPAFQSEGILSAEATRVLSRTGLYDHCNFTVSMATPTLLTERFVALLLAMSWEDPSVQPLLEMEGLRRWLPGRVTGYALLERAVDANLSV